MKRGQWPSTPRKCKNHNKRRREPRPAAIPPAPRTVNDVVAEAERISQVLAPISPPWVADIDDPHRDAQGRIIAGAWTGKIYAGPTFSPYMGDMLPGEGLAVDERRNPAVIVTAICDLRNVLPELLRLARHGAAALANEKKRGGL